MKTPIPPDPADLKERARLFSELEAALETNIKEAEFLAREAFATTRLPSALQLLSKAQIESNIRNAIKIQAEEEMTGKNLPIR